MNPAAIKISGECTIERVSQLHQQITSPLSTNKTIAIDLSEMESIDAAGIQLLVSIKNSAEAKGKPLELISIPDFLPHSLQDLGFEANFLSKA